MGQEQPVNKGETAGVFKKKPWVSIKKGYGPGGVLCYPPGQQGQEAIWTKGTLTPPHPQEPDLQKAIQVLLRDLYLALPQVSTLEEGMLKWPWGISGLC